MVTQKVTSKNFTMLPNEILLDRRLSVYAKTLYTYLKHRQGRNGDCWPSTETIAEELNISRPTVRKATAELLEHGWIEAQISRGGRKHTNRYRVLDAPSPDGPTGQRTPAKTGNVVASKTGNEIASNDGNWKGDCRLTGNVVASKDPSHVKNARKAITTEEEPIAKSYSFSATKQRIGELIDRHISLCPVAKPSHRPKLLSKCRYLIARHGPDAVGAWIEQFSPQANQGDGWGLIAKAPDTLKKRQIEQEGRSARERAEQEKTRVERELSQPIVDPQASEAVQKVCETDTPREERRNHETRQQEEENRTHQTRQRQIQAVMSEPPPVTARPPERTDAQRQADIAAGKLRNQAFIDAHRNGELLEATA